MNRSSLRSADNEDYQKLKAIKYPVRPISNAIILKKKLNSFSSPIQATLKREIPPEINAYRQVRGDGNCFFRAFAFTYIASKKNHELKDVFSLLDKIKLDTCKPESIPKAFQPFYDDQRLKAVLKKRWDDDYGFFLKNNRYNSKRALSRLFNENHYLDFIVILYFRAVCVGVLRTQQQYKQFLSSEADEITTYGCESEGVTINLCSNFFHRSIRILQVRANEVIPYDYMTIKNTYLGNQRVDLLYSDAHYDIIEKNDDPLAEFDDEKMEEQYFSEIKYNYIHGTCLECQRKAEISEQTGLCSDCHSKSLQNFNSFQKDTTIQGQCTQCNRKTKISQDLLMCEQCLLQLQYASNSGIRMNEVSNSGIKMNEPPREASFQPGKYFKEDRCLSCMQIKKYSELNVDKICQECLRKQEELEQINAQSIISIGSNKLESKISRQKREQEQDERKKVMQAQIRSKVALGFHCKQCQEYVRVNSEEELKQNNDQICPNCQPQFKKQSQIKSSKVDVQQSGTQVRPNVSGVRQSGRATTCRRCGKIDIYFPLTPSGMCSKCKRIIQ